MILVHSTDERNHHDGDEGNSSGNDEGGGGQGTRGGQDKEQDSGREGNHGVEESKSFEPEDLPHNKRRRDRQEEELPNSSYQNDSENDGGSSARRMMEKALQNELECKVAALVDTCTFLLLLLRYLSLIRRIT